MNALGESAGRADDSSDRRESTNGRIRLSCHYCGIELDGINCVPPEWTEVEEIRSYEQAIEPIPDGQDRNKYGDTLVDWETHMGVCPECQRELTGEADG